ncbi:S9 family peptidase [Dyella mobilis]|uniref:Prolyl oligopeptidase family serine peptidase n=1 Tax=Dyella mobilis TaxID=1849582 RepID=A0ABS2KLR0_9GAMM|nr:prolyl oligopeptidase family serine peptidase [Dyella mobilis]MBM7131875.1 prolyl oligopeptidase family serine peptidase [Dyella mobilis]GLQ96142.1 peptidase S9 [Dyella mobilis]
MKRFWLACLLVSVAFACMADGAPKTMDYFQRAEYERVAISPDGALLAIVHREDDSTQVTVVRRADMQVVAQIGPGSRGEIGDLSWLGSDHLVLSANRDSERYHQPISDPWTYLVDIHAKHPQTLDSNFFGTVSGDEHHFLVRECKDFMDGECRFSVKRYDIDHLMSKPDELGEAPIGDASLMVDHTGTVRIAWAWSKTARSQLYVRDDSGKWTSINDSDATHVEEIPLGISRDNKLAFLQRERTDAPDIIESYDFASGKRTELLSDPVSDPLHVIYSMDGKEPIGAWFGPGVPRARYWAPSSEDAKWHSALVKAFPNTVVDVVSSTANGSTLIVYAYSDRDEGSWYLLDRVANKATLLFHSRPWLDATAMAAMEPFQLKARDGLPLHGFLSRAHGTTGPAPMVVIVHGGPYYIADDWMFDGETQFLAAHGYSVLHVNFRGSANFGQRFMKIGYHQWGRGMVNDITDATQWAIAQGVADPKRICIYGGSYGGYAALMSAAREPTLYRCAIGLAGPYDLSKLYRWGDIHRSDYGEYYLNIVLGLDKAALLADSPVSHASDITIPVLLVHGQQDERVPIQYAKAMQSALKKSGHPAQFVSYDWEGHGLVDPADQLDFYTRMLTFLSSNIGPGTDNAGSGAVAASGDVKGAGGN